MLHNGLSLVVRTEGCSSLQCEGFSLPWLFLLQGGGYRVGGLSSCGLWAPEHVGPELSCAGLAVPRHGIFPDQGSNPCPLHWQADSLPLDHQGRPHTHSSSQLRWVRNPDGASFSFSIKMLVRAGVSSEAQIGGDPLASKLEITKVSASIHIWK